MRDAEKKQYARQNSYNKDHYDRVGTLLPKGSRDRIRVKAESLGMTVNAFLKKVILDSLDD